MADRIIKRNAEFLTIDAKCVNLANKYLKEKIVTAKYQSDLLYIAAATINKVDVVTSWNFKHIVNLKKIRLYNSVNLKYGYSIIDIRSPGEIASL